MAFRMKSVARSNPSRKGNKNILDEYVQGSPTEQRALDLLKGEWASHIPAPFDHLEAGRLPLFLDRRIHWGLKQLGDVTGFHCLELGPLEGGHSYMLEQAGVKDVLAIESNQRAFLKCLIVKNLLNLTKTHFLLGNFIPFLETDKESYDLVLASGVLYHMQEPVRVLRLIGQRTDRLFLWTHYFDEAIIRSQPHLSKKFGRAIEVEDQGHLYTVHKQKYGAALAISGFCGGGTQTTTWMTRESILSCLAHQGYNDIKVDFEEPDHQNGPCFALVATRETSRNDGQPTSPVDRRQ